MRVSVFILWIMILTLISLVCLTYILTNIDPYNATNLTLILFYLNFFIVTAGIFILGGFYLRKLIIKKRTPSQLLRTSFKQGVLISLILTIFLLLRSFEVL